MSDPKSNGSNNGNGNAKDAAVAKTAGFVVFSGIAMSIIKALTPNNNSNNMPKWCGSSPPNPPTQTPQQESLKPTSHDKSPSPRTVEIVKGDTLWGLSRKYGVSINAIKEANGLKGDTIYAGKKLIIP